MEVHERPPVIPPFYAGREVFITGATGFVGKVLVERLLATCPDIGILHLLMRSKKNLTPETRLRELKNSQVFDVLRRTSPGQLDKLRAVCGDITKPNLGLSDRSRADLKNVSVVFNAAATVKLEEELSSAVETNVLSVMRLLDICDQLPNLAAWLHVSTAYCHAERSLVEERVYPPPRPLQRIIEDTQRSTHMTLRDTKTFISPKPNTYTFTKMLAEFAVFEHGHKGYPRAIFRPTIVISSARHPFAGWVERYSGPAGAAAAASCGALRVMRCDGAARADLLPVDVAVDTLIAAAWETAVDQLSSVRVYNCSTQNRTDWEAMRRSIEDTSRVAPSAHAIWYPQLLFARSRFTYKSLEFIYQILPLHFAEFIRLCFYNNTNSTSLIHLSHRLSAMCDALEYFTTREFRFRADNMRRLRARLSERDRALYNLDPSTIEWEVTLKNFVLGVRRHVLKEKDETIPAARERLRRLYILHRGLTILIPVLISIYLFTRTRGNNSLLRSITMKAIWFHRIVQNTFPSVSW